MSPFLRHNPDFQPTLAWLIRLRWAAVVGQIITVLVARFWIGLPMPEAIVLLLIGITAVTNLGFQLRENIASPLRNSFFGGILFFDTMTFTFLLACTGGVHNPFASFYLVQVAMAAVALGATATWAMACMVTVCYAGLFLFSNWSPNPHAFHMVIGENLHLEGMVVATSITAVSIAYFAGRLGLELRERERALGEFRLMREQSERFAAIATLAAGVAHEIATPLGTVAIAAKELEHVATKMSNGTAVVDDARLILSEVQRCRHILERLHGQATESLGETTSVVKGADLWNEIKDSLSARDAARARFAIPRSRRPMTRILTLLKASWRKLPPTAAW